MPIVRGPAGAAGRRRSEEFRRPPMSRRGRHALTRGVPAPTTPSTRRVGGVFVDDGGRRARWTRRAGAGLGLSLLAYLGVVIAALAGAPWVPRATLPVGAGTAEALGGRAALTPDAIRSTPAVVPGPAEAASPPAVRTTTSAVPVTAATEVTTSTTAAPVTTPLPTIAATTTTPAPTTTVPGLGDERRTTPSTRADPPGTRGRQ